MNTNSLSFSGLLAEFDVVLKNLAGDGSALRKKIIKYEKNHLGT